MKFPQDSEVKLTVIDPNTMSHTVTRTLRVLRTKTLQTSDVLLNARIELQTKITASKRLTNNGIVCTASKTGTCALNFS